MTSKMGENLDFIKVLAVFAVEKPVENVKTFRSDSPFYGGKVTKIPLSSTDKKENCGGKVDNSVENLKIGQFSPKNLHTVKKTHIPSQKR